MEPVNPSPVDKEVRKVTEERKNSDNPENHQNEAPLEHPNIDRSVPEGIETSTLPLDVHEAMPRFARVMNNLSPYEEQILQLISSAAPQPVSYQTICARTLIDPDTVTGVLVALAHLGRVELLDHHKPADLEFMLTTQTA